MVSRFYLFICLFLWILYLSKAFRYKWNAKYPQIIHQNAVSVSNSYYCYFLRDENRTYNGYTVNIKRRLRQQNGEIAGGARATRRGRGNWSYFLILHSPDWTSKRALQVEWLCRFPTRKSRRPYMYNRPLGRLLSLSLVCKQIKENTFLYVHRDFYSQAEALELPANIEVRPLEELLKEEKPKTEEAVSKNAKYAQIIHHNVVSTVEALKLPAKIVRPLEELLEEKPTTEEAFHVSKNAKHTQIMHHNPVPVSLPKSYYCYFLREENLTQNGYTVNLHQKLLTHNQAARNWSYFAILHSPDWTESRAININWLCQYPTRQTRRPYMYNRPLGRLLSLSLVCMEIKENTFLYVHRDFYSQAEALELPANIEVRPLEELLEEEKPVAKEV
jgi:predicted GIY-YIG superfamily endonuclease